MKKLHIILLISTIVIGIFSVSMAKKYVLQPTRGTESNVTFAEDLVVEMQAGPMKVIPLTAASKTDLMSFRKLVAKELPNAKNDPSIHYSIDESRGLISFSRGMQQYQGSFRPVLPSPENAADLSLDFLKTSGMLPKNADQLKLVHNGGLRAAAVTRGKKGPTIDKLRTLTYGREIDGIPVTGEGSRIIVNVGDKGSIVSVIHRWKDDAGKGRVVSIKEMKSLEAAKKEILKVIANEFSGKAKVNEIQQIYYNGNGNYIQPVYAFVAEISNPGIPTAEYFGVIPAMLKAPEPVDLHRRDDKKALEVIQQSNQKNPPKVSVEQLD